MPSGSRFSARTSCERGTAIQPFPRDPSCIMTSLAFLSDLAIRYARPLFGFPLLVSRLKSFAKSSRLGPRRAPEVSARSSLTAGEGECIFILVNHFHSAPPVLHCAALPFAGETPPARTRIYGYYRAKKSSRLRSPTASTCSFAMSSTPTWSAGSITGSTRRTTQASRTRWRKPAMP